MRARLSLSPREIEKPFSKAIYHVLDNTGQLLPSCFPQRHERVLLIYARTQGCSRPIAGQVPLLSEGVFAYTIEHFALPLIQIEIGSGSGSRTQPSPGYEPSMQPMHRPAILKLKHLSHRRSRTRIAHIRMQPRQWMRTNRLALAWVRCFDPI